MLVVGGSGFGSVADARDAAGWWSRPSNLFAVAALAAFSSLAAQAQGEVLFSPADARAEGLATVVSTSVDGEALRRREARIDLELLDRARQAVVGESPAPRSLVLNLFDDVALTGVVERTAPTFSGGYSVSGGIAGQPLASMTLVVNGEVVAGSVQTLDGTYRIRTVGEGRYTIDEVDPLGTPDSCGVAAPGESPLEQVEAETPGGLP